MTTPSSINPLTDQLKAFETKISQHAGCKISYIGGATCRLHKALKTSSRVNPDILHNQAIFLESKIEKILLAISEITQRSLTEGKWESTVTSSKRTYLVKKQANHIQIISKKLLDRFSKKIGQGKTSLIYTDRKEIHELVLKKPSADLAHTVFRENNILHLIHQDAPIPGIVSAPKALIEHSESDKSLLLEKFHCDLSEAEIEIPIILIGFSNMYKALTQIHEKGIYHTDIHLKNIGIFGSDINDPLRLSDWGIAVKRSTKCENLAQSDYEDLTNALIRVLTGQIQFIESLSSYQLLERRLKNPQIFNEIKTMCELLRENSLIDPSYVHAWAERLKTLVTSVNQ